MFEPYLYIIDINGNKRLLFVLDAYGMVRKLSVMIEIWFEVSLLVDLTH